MAQENEGSAGFDRLENDSRSSKLGRPILFFGLVNVLESMFFRRSGITDKWHTYSKEIVKIH